MLGYMLFQWVDGGLHISFIFIVLVVWFSLVAVACSPSKTEKKQGDQHFHNHFADDTERKVDERERKISSEI
jgi:hypothetical protein